MSAMRRVIFACVMVGLASSEAAPPSSCVASTEDPSSCITPSDDATNLMQQKIRVHKGKQEAGVDSMAINCRVIGATKLMTPTQTTAAANEMFISGCTRVDWDGDAMKAGCFAEAIGKWKALILKGKRLPEGEVADPEDYERTKDLPLPEPYSAHAHCSPTTGGATDDKTATGFFSGWGCDEPVEDQATAETIQEAEDYINQKLGMGANEKVGQYLRLAVADYQAHTPKFVFWLLEEDRCQGLTPNGDLKELSDWVSLAEYKALYSVTSGVKWVIIDKCGKQVNPSKAERDGGLRHQAKANTCTEVWNAADATGLGWATISGTADMPARASTTSPALSQPMLKETTGATTCQATEIEAPVAEGAEIAAPPVGL